MKIKLLVDKQIYADYGIWNLGREDWEGWLVEEDIGLGLLREEDMVKEWRLLYGEEFYNFEYFYKLEPRHALESKINNI